MSTPAGIWQKFFSTDASITTLILRLAVGGAMLPHGAQKLLGWWGGAGFAGTMERMSGQFPAPIVVLVILGESLGALALMLGFGARFMALGLAIIMAGAFFINLPNGFFINWMMVEGQRHGVQFQILYVGAAIPLIIRGAGAFSVDRVIAGLLAKSKA
jgi:putative oxidoreductase